MSPGAARRARAWRTAGAAVVLAAASACGGRRDPSAEAVNALVRAANRRDAGAIVSALAPGFRGPAGMSRDDLDAELRRLFAAYASVDVSISGLAVEAFPGFDLVRFHAAFRGRARKIGGLDGILPASARYRFELRLFRDGEKRIVSNAEWEEIGDGESPGREPAPVSD